MARDQCEVSDTLFRYEDGELVLSDNDTQVESRDENEHSTVSKKGRRKQTFERRNIKKVREDALNEEAKAAQMAEMERRKRLTKENADSAKFSTIEFLLNEDVMVDHIALKSEDIEKRAQLEPLKNGHYEEPTMEHQEPVTKSDPDCKGPIESSGYSRGETTKMDADEMTIEHVEVEKSKKSLIKSASVGCASLSLFGATWKSNRRMQTGYSRDDAILLGDSDDDTEQTKDAVMIELSDGDDEAVEESELETEICELQDATNLTDEQGRVVINTNRDVNNEPAIFLPPHIAKIIKPHQINGIRFLYDNLIESRHRFESTEGFGCILAHSMGLGKTIQVIGFLEAIFRHCHVHRVLVVVPINTIQNWQAEFEMWLPTDTRSTQMHSDNRSQCETESCSQSDESPSTIPKHEFPTTESSADLSQKCEPHHKADGNIDGPTEFTRPFKLFVVRDVVKTMAQRHQIIRQWYDQGGVLLLGYEMFRLLLSRKRPIPGVGWSKAEMRAAARRRRKKIGAICVDLEKEERMEKMFADFRTALLDPGPQLVICDEGHRIKNSEASISKALKAIRTRRRVVLTGYPLQNNLMEYWCMVDFVRPNYLGTKQEFTNMFQRPIENGQCVDSTQEDRKVMQGRAHVLHDLLSGFVQRRSHAVLKASLPPKTEVVLLVKLSPLQRALYAAFMRSLNSCGPFGWAQVNTLKTYAMCCKIWNHPDILWRAMEEHKEAMDFDIDDPSTSSSFNTRQRSETSNERQTDESMTHTSETGVVSWPLRPGVPEVSNSSFSSSAGVPPQSTTSTAFSNRGSMNSASTYNTQSSMGTYDWASDTELWGVDFKPGNVEHSGKILLFLSLLEACVQAGDKLLVFTQSLYTLDLLERILRRLPLPECATHTTLRMNPSAESQETAKPSSDAIKPDLSSAYDFKEDIPCENFHFEPQPVPGGLSSVRQTFFKAEAINMSNTVDKNVSQMPQCVGQNRTIDYPQNTYAVSEEENLRSLHYRLASGSLRQPAVWTKNVHYFRLDGSTTASEREKLINHFNNPENPAKLFLVSTRAGCLGVNLIGANRVVVFDASWNPCHDCQAVCRVYRYGQVKPCYIYRLVSDNTMEKRIYDRQVTKQGMSDRVVDELNPSQQFTRSQVELLMSFEDKDMPSLTDDDLNTCADLIAPDPVLASVLHKHKAWITKVPFTHESLLIDRKDYRLTRVEKRLARQRYEQEKRLSLSYQRAHLYQYQQMQTMQNQQLIAAGINPALVDQSRLFGRTPNILSRSAMTYRPTYTPGSAALDAMRQVQRSPRFNSTPSWKRDELARSSDCKVTRVVATTDLYFPSTSESVTAQRKIPKGEVMEIIQTPKGKYLRITRTGDLFVVKTTVNNESPIETIDEPPAPSIASPHDSTLLPEPTVESETGSSAPNKSIPTPAQCHAATSCVQTVHTSNQPSIGHSPCSNVLTAVPCSVEYAVSSISTPSSVIQTPLHDSNAPIRAFSLEQHSDQGNQPTVQQNNPQNESLVNALYQPPNSCPGDINCRTPVISSTPFHDDSDSIRTAYYQQSRSWICPGCKQTECVCSGSVNGAAMPPRCTNHGLITGSHHTDSRSFSGAENFSFHHDPNGIFQQQLNALEFQRLQQQQQQQEHYLRASEHVARQSTAAYIDLDKQHAMFPTENPFPESSHYCSNNAPNFTANRYQTIHERPVESVHQNPRSLTIQDYLSRLNTPQPCYVPAFEAQSQVPTPDMFYSAAESGQFSRANVGDFGRYPTGATSSADGSRLMASLTHRQTPPFSFMPSTQPAPFYPQNSSTDFRFS